MSALSKHALQDAPVVQLVDAIIYKAIAQHASDIHLESTPVGLRVRYRIDGILYDQPLVDKKVMFQLLSRIKVLAHIDIAEKRVPQDGKFQLVSGDNSIDLRVSTFPSIYGEKIVVRILDRAHTMIALDNLGLNAAMLASFSSLVNKSNGFFLATGPTGSGKTTTLYAALALLSSPETNIITLEDPVEYNIDGITQGQINPDAGFTFEKGIRAILRQDPDIVMVGEIRDRQTAQIAIEAALTGHVVLSTLHTNDAPSVIMRLIDMGIEPFLINAAVSGVLAQRLARKICNNCRIAVEPTDYDKALLKRFNSTIDRIYKGKGCDVCFQLGYKGRIGIFELLEISSTLRGLIVQHPNADALQLQARQGGMKTLAEDGLDKVARGIITLQELARIL